MDIELSGVPLWLVAAPFGAGSVWAVALEDGTTQAFLVQSGRAVAMDITSASLPAGAPAALAVAGDEAYLLAAPLGGASEPSHTLRPKVTVKLIWRHNRAFQTHVLRT